MIRANEKHVVQRLAPQAADKSLAKWIHVQGTHSGFDHFRPHTLCHAVEHSSKFFIPVADQKPRLYSVHRCVAKLLRSPLLRGAARGRSVHYLARPLVHDEEKKHGPKQQVVGLHKVAAPDVVCMVSHERGPTSALCLVGAPAAYTFAQFACSLESQPSEARL